MRSRILIALAGLGVVTAMVVAQPGKEKEKPGKEAKPAAPAAHQPDFELPPGMTQEDMQACMEAGTPGEMHAFLAEGVGTWAGEVKHWMGGPESEPLKSECTSTVTMMMDGRFTKTEISGDSPQMGPFTGFGIYGYDNVAGEFQSTWVDNFGTGMMRGTGTMGSDGKSITWIYDYHCPVTKQVKTMREVQRWTGKDKMTLSMFGTMPRGEEEFKMMEITFTRTGATTASGEKH